LLTNPETNIDKFFKIILSQPFNIDPKDYEALYKRKSMYKSITESIKSIPDEELINPERLRHFLQVFNHLKAYKNNETLKNVILEIGTKTGIFDYYINSEINKIENIAGLKKIVDEAIDFSSSQKKITLEEYVEYLEMTIKDKIIIKTEKAPLTMNAVQLSTYHSSKGREFEYVYMPTLVKDKWESSNQSVRPTIPLEPSEYKNSEELTENKYSDLIRLLYVGMTRAKHTLRLSYPLLIGTSTKTLTSFISNILNQLEKEKAPEYNINSFWEERTKTLLKRDYDYKTDFCTMVDNRLQGKSFSPSAINKYLNCPREYFYNYILDLDTKESVSDALNYGSAIHQTCEFAVTSAIKNREYPSKEIINNEFEKILNSYPMTSFSQREIHLGRGKSKLSEFYAQLTSTPVSYLHKVEEPVEFEMNGIKFYGVIDRIDKNPDGTYSIYDYKTGKAKTQKQIAPNGEYENYYNQIGLYKYFFEKATGEKVSETTFIFPEESTKNLTINFTQDECEEIKSKFEQAINNIKNYKFEPNYKNCKYCSFKDFCNMENV
jgi:DNA helicase-2/ATP-dependent DNA helicase PcrA